MDKKRSGKKYKYKGFLNESSLSTDVEIDLDDITKRKTAPLEEIRCSQNVAKADDYDYNNMEMESEEETDKSLEKIKITPRAGYISYTDADVLLKWMESSHYCVGGENLKGKAKAVTPKSYRDEDGKLVLLEADVYFEEGRTIVNLADFARGINRDAEPIERYLLRSLRATGAFLKNDMLLILGVYDKAVIQKLLNALIDDYVACKRCKKYSKTTVSVISKMYRLKCHLCEEYRYLGRVLYAPLNTSSRYIKK